MKNVIDTRGTTRSYAEINDELQAIYNERKGKMYKEGCPRPEYKLAVVADALGWGYRTARTSFALERYLYDKKISLLEFCRKVSETWDGSDWLAGALHAAQEYAKQNPHEGKEHL